MIKAFWFNNRQEMSDVLHPDFFTPKTCFQVQAALPNAVAPVKIRIAAVCGGIAMFEQTYVVEELEPGGIVILQKSTDTLENDPEQLDIQIITGENVYTKSIKCEYAVISGKTTDFNGNPFLSAVVFNMASFEGMESGLGVWSDAEGYYSIRLPKGEYNSVFVDDNSYGQTSLEAWGWKMIIDRNESHDFKIGNGEVYSMDIWANNGGAQSLFVYFRPMVLSYAMQAMAQESKPVVTLNSKDYAVLEASPDINIEDVSVEINGRKAINISLQKIFETAPDGSAFPAYILQCERHYSVDKQTMILEYIFKDSDGNLAQSQGRTQFYYINSYGVAVR